MVIISKKPIKSYLDRYPQHETALMNWYFIVLEADWSCFADIKKTFNSVDAVGNGLYIFNVKGNHCRIVPKIRMKSSITHLNNFKSVASLSLSH